MTQPTTPPTTPGSRRPRSLILLLVVGSRSLLIAIGAAPWEADLGELRTLLTSPDDGTLALVVFAVVAWIAWAVMAVSVVVEVVARVRGSPPPRSPASRSPSAQPASWSPWLRCCSSPRPTVVAAFPTRPPMLRRLPPVLESASAGGVAAHARPPQKLRPSRLPRRRDTSTATVDYTVKRGDSLWKIAERLLGDGARYTEIVELNRDVLNGRPDFIVSGTCCAVPHEVPRPTRPAATRRSTS